MFIQFFSIGFLMLFSAMLPGPDFAIVSKNTLLHSRRAGIMTSLGVGCAIVVHMIYCLLGLALIISHSPWLFNLIKYIGAAYLIYLGISSWLSNPAAVTVDTTQSTRKSGMPDFTAWRQGFLCNLLNPKATLFFLALFTVIIKPDVTAEWGWMFALEMIVIAVAWFCALTWILSHPRVTAMLQNAEKYIAKVLGIFLIGFGLVLALMGVK